MAELEPFKSTHSGVSTVDESGIDMAYVDERRNTRVNYMNNIDAIDEYNKNVLCRQRCCYHSVILIIQLIILIIPFMIMFFTFGIDYVIIITTLIIFAGLIVFISIITTIMYVIKKYCFDKPKSFQLNCLQYTCNIVFVWYLFQIFTLFLVATLLITFYHPYLKGPFDDIFLKGTNGITFRNYWQTVEYQAYIWRPETVLEIQNIIIDEGIISNKKIIAVGSGHSSADLFNNDIMISLDNFKNISISNDSNSVIVGAGAVLKDVEDYLFEFGYVLLGFGNTQSQRMGGMLGTSVYGVYGSMNKYLKSVWFVDGNGNDIYVNIDNNDTYVSALKTSLGVLGIIYQLEFIIEPTFNIKRSDESLSLNIFNTISSSQFNELFFPNNSNILGRRLRMNPFGFNLESFTNVSEPATIIDRQRNEAFRSLVNDYLLVLECLIPDMANIGDKYEIELETNSIDTDIYAVKTSTQSDNIFHGGFIYVLPFNSCQSALIDLQELLDDQFPSTATVIALKQDSDYGYLSYAVDTDVCLIEVYPPICSENRLDLGINFEQQILLKYGGSVHWSKQLISINDINNLTDNSITQFYSNFDTFNDLRKTLDPNNIFLNKYTERIFDDNSENIIDYPLIDQYRKNSKSWEFVGWYCIVVCIVITLVIGALNLKEKFNEKLLLYNNDNVKDFFITVLIVIIVESGLAIGIHFIVNFTVSV